MGTVVTGRETDCAAISECLRGIDGRAGRHGHQPLGRQHIGWMAEQVQASVEHDRFPEWLHTTMASIAAAAVERRRLEARVPGNVVPAPVPLVVVFYCRAGRHRSVTATILVEHLLESTALCLPVSRS